MAIGLGTVSKDSLTIQSNPGVGVVKAGWHCGAQPGGSGCCEGPGDCDDYCAISDDNCNSGCKIKLDRPLKAVDQIEGNCRLETCGGGDNDIFPYDDLPEDKPNDCYDPSCAPPPVVATFDDSEIPLQDCMECNQGLKEIKSHVEKRIQLPDDCKVLFCDGVHEDAPTEPLPESRQFKGDCRELKCDYSEVPADDREPDFDYNDCKRPICNGMDTGFELASWQAPEGMDVTGNCAEAVCTSYNPIEAHLKYTHHDEPKDIPFDCRVPRCREMNGNNNSAWDSQDYDKGYEVKDACKSTVKECRYD